MGESSREGLIGMKFKVNEVFHSIQGEGRGPVRDRYAGAGGRASGASDPGVVMGAPRSPEGWERRTRVKAVRG